MNKEETMKNLGHSITPGYSQPWTLCMILIFSSQGNTAEAEKVEND